MQTNISFLKQILIRLGLPSPQLFKTLQAIFYVLGALFTGFTVFNSLAPNEWVSQGLKIAGYIGTAVSAMGAFLVNLPVADPEQLEAKIKEEEYKEEARK